MRANEFKKEMIFFTPGDVVKIKHLKLSPEMCVKHVNKTHLKDEENRTMMLGITCFWFTTEGLYQEKMFSTKDLVRVL